MKKFQNVKTKTNTYRMMDPEMRSLIKEPRIATHYKEGTDITQEV